jgi:catecholate siderophore receptor
MLAVSVSGWPQTTTPVQTDSKTLTTQTVTGTRDRDAQTYQRCHHRRQMPVAAKDVPQSLTVVNDKLIHDQGKA